MTDYTQQTHPLYAIDRDQIDAVLGDEGEPGPQQLTTIAALFSRYADFPGAEDIRDDLQKCLTLWGLSRDELNLKTREIWESGWRPGQDPVAEVLVLGPMWRMQMLDACLHGSSLNCLNVSPR